MKQRQRFQVSRREMLRLGAMAGAATLIGGRRAWAQSTCIETPGDLGAPTGCGTGAEEMAVSPFILEPFTQELPIPKALRPGWRYIDGTLIPSTDPNAWYCRNAGIPYRSVPGPELGYQDAMGDRPANNGWRWGLPNAGTHQLWPGTPGTPCEYYPQPKYYHIRLQVAEHKHTTSKVVNIDSAGNFQPLPPGVSGISGAGTVTWKGVSGVPAYYLPGSTIYGFNGTFPGPMINAAYGQPVCVRFENDLDYNPQCLDRQNFGAPDWAFLTHLHNGHTAPESDGNPNHLVDNDGGYLPEQWSDNLYLCHPAGGDPREMQSFLWFHDHRMHHTGWNVYKGMVGLMPHYDPLLDNGDERTGLRLPGVRTDNADGTFDVDYDIPMAFYDCRLDDGVTPHRDDHTPMDVCGNTHPEWWGKLFGKHYVNHGFVGDIFTVNGVAYPVLVVKRRKYRFRFLGASISRQYDLSIRQGTPMMFPGQQGQWNFGQLTKGARFVTTDKGVVCMKMMQIASEGGLLPTPIDRKNVEIWPAKRREVIVDFTKYIDGTPTRSGDVMYLTNTLQMLNGRKATDNQEPGFDAQFAVPMVKIIIDGSAADNSVMPIPGRTVLREAPPFDPAAVPARTFTLGRSGLPGETEWVINGMEFDPLNPLATPTLGSAEAWAINNGGGGWTHPMHLHQEEHHVIFRSTPSSRHPDDTGKEDVVALDQSEQTVIYRRFRTFLGNYVAHCHQLLHEDHNMMFGWTIVP